ncbi:DUF5680 domain-containing protein [Pelagibacterium xiamenense]|uniref:DUF5680 domain-containing protein n=1 Tax=Pelagibacterium xiamenense TaxID=2901140 RepID=UPI001E4B87FD|nr:DUF5680 domain-containing protein [Pelagibacterium xiamenense]MCD7060111.1 DUF5680 domain-containing protein [Pelagibacterium xiamenense]
MDLSELEGFVVEAKRATYVGTGAPAESSRPGAHDMCHARGRWSYRDSYFGGTDFLGQETVWHDGEPVWAMNYYGYIVRPHMFDARRAGETTKAALCAMYAEGRFLGGFEWDGPHGVYRDVSRGTVAQFHGRETIAIGGVVLYGLDYCGGLIRP